MEVIDAHGVSFTVLNERIREMVDNGCREIVLNNICGHRYIGCGLGTGYQYHYQWCARQ